MRLAFDMSSVLWTCISVGTDPEGQKIEHKGRVVTVNSAPYGYENAVNHMIATMKLAGVMPKDIIMVFEGMNSKAPRLNINPRYKSNRGDRPMEAYAVFQELSERLKTTWRKLGACAITQDEVEGDDVMGYLAYNIQEDLRISTNDNDLAVLNFTNQHGAEIDTMVNGAVGLNKYGDFPLEYITLYKATVGDSSDSVIGIKGFGQVAWDAFVAEFGEAGMLRITNLANQGSLDELVPEMENKTIAKFVNAEKEFLNSWQLVKLHPEWVNTLNHPLRFEPGLIKGSTDDERLTIYEGVTELVTSENWDQFREKVFEDMAVGPYVGLDIETSTPDESDEWLAAMGNPEGVDVIGSELTGMSLTYGYNLHKTVYIQTDHLDKELNVPKELIRKLLEDLQALGLPIIIQNYSFEGTVFYNTWGELWKDNGNAGLLPNCYDTKLEASYVDENSPLGLKKIAKKWFGYDQTEYNTVTRKMLPRGTWKQGDPGRLIAETPEGEDIIQYKMRELTGAHVQDYGCDDTIVTVSAHNVFHLIMQLENTWEIYRQVELPAMYGHTQSFIHGTKIDVGKSKELEAIDDETYNKAELTLNEFLVTAGWEGCVKPVYPADLTPAQLKEAFLICTGKELVTSVRKPERLLEVLQTQGVELFTKAYELCMTGDAETLNNLVTMNWKAAPVFNSGSTKQMATLLYETMGLPVRVFNKATPVMRKAGIRQGSPKTDELAIAYAKMMDATPEQKTVLEALRLMKMVQTRRGLYYSTYPFFVHWKTGKIHSSHNQCATVTRRASSSTPNLQQQPKHPKIEGQPARFREVMVPHKRKAVIVSMDFAAQELRVIADYSQDPNMLACYVGDHPKDMHSMTGVGIAIRKKPEMQWDLDVFTTYLGDEDSPLYKFVKECRALGKKVNFTTEYGAMAPKLAMTMLIPEDEAQAYIDAKEAAFPVVREWKDSVIEEVNVKGYVCTMLGARRHLGGALTSGDKWEASKAERQAVNYKVQGSCAEMTKLAEGRMWEARLEQRFDCQIIGPVHDEVVASVAISDLEEFIPAMHACMVQRYASMNVPVESSISFGPSFGRQIEIGNLPTKEAIAAGLVDYYKIVQQ